MKVATKSKNDPIIRECGSCPIQHRAVCSRCDHDELSYLEQIKTYKTYDAGCPIILAGDDMNWVGSLVLGMATLSSMLEDGRRQHVGLLFPSDFVGSPGRTKALYDVYAAADVTICRFDQNKFDHLLLSVPHLSTRLLEMMADELDASRDWMMLLGRKTAREKVASLLHLFARKKAGLENQTVGNRIDIDLQLSREDIADFLGLTLETVSRQINGLKKEGIIAMTSKRQMTILSLSDLVNLSGDDADGGALF